MGLGLTSVAALPLLQFGNLSVNPWPLYIVGKREVNDGLCKQQLFPLIKTMKQLNIYSNICAT